jgi:hypothetical protein
MPPAQKQEIPMTLSPDDMRELFQQTVIVRKPTFGIVRGYHELPYVCIGEAVDSAARTTRVSGRIQVSPQFIIKPSHYQNSYEDIFGDDVFGGEEADRTLAGRVFGFLGFPGRPVECSSGHLEVEGLDKTVDQTLSESLDKLERLEDITTGVIITPNSRYYPVSIERFITSVLDDEFSF